LTWRARLIPAILVCTVILSAATASANPTDGAATESPNITIIEAQELVIKDSEGRIRIKLGMTGVDGVEQPRISIYDKNGLGVLAIEGGEGGSFSIFRPWLGDSPDSNATVLNSWSTMVPTFYQWVTLQMVAAQNVGGWALTDKINKQGLTAFYDDTAEEGAVRLFLTVNTITQPSWNKHTGLGQFSVSDREVRTAYELAGNAVLEIVRSYYGYMAPTELEIVFYIQGYLVGTWVNGKMKLAGEY